MTVMTTAGEDLIRRMTAGDREAFSRFYDRYAPLVYPLILRVVRDRSDAADVLQEVFWEAWRSAAAYDPARGTPEAWMIARARSRAIDRVRAGRRHSATFGPLVEDGLTPGPVEAGGDAAERAEDRGIVRTALESLPRPQREVIELAYYAGLTQTEIAEHIRQPLGTVKTRIRLGLERLRDVMSRTP